MAEYVHRLNGARVVVSDDRRMDASVWEAAKPAQSAPKRATRRSAPKSDAPADSGDE